jgi:hypothetical protein
MYQVDDETDNQELLREDEVLHEEMRRREMGEERTESLNPANPTVRYEEDEDDEQLSNISSKLEEEAKEADEEARAFEMKGNWACRDSYRNKAILLRSKAAKVRQRKNRINLPF